MLLGQRAASVAPREEKRVKGPNRQLNGSLDVHEGQGMKQQEAVKGAEGFRRSKVST